MKRAMNPNFSTPKAYPVVPLTETKPVVIPLPLLPALVEEQKFDLLSLIGPSPPNLYVNLSTPPSYSPLLHFRL